MSDSRRPPFKTSQFAFNHAYRCTYLDHSEGIRGTVVWYRWVFAVGQVLETVFLHSDNPQERQLHQRLTDLALVPEQSILLTRVKHGDEPFTWRVELDQPALTAATEVGGSASPAGRTTPTLRDLAQLMRDCILASQWAWDRAGVDDHSLDNVQATASTLFIDARKCRLASADVAAATASTGEPGGPAPTSGAPASAAVSAAGQTAQAAYPAAPAVPAPAGSAPAARGSSPAAGPAASPWPDDDLPF